ncbi:hypothetical protein J2S53_002425 [Actinopolyspora lacussalsi]|nr:hypothetical protein [Actinopolyspora lacussalsi]
MRSGVSRADRCVRYTWLPPCSGISPRDRFPTDKPIRADETHSSHKGIIRTTSILIRSSRAGCQDTLLGTRPFLGPYLRAPRRRGPPRVRSPVVTTGHAPGPRNSWSADRSSQSSALGNSSWPDSRTREPRETRDRETERGFTNSSPAHHLYSDRCSNIHEHRSQQPATPSTGEALLRSAAGSPTPHTVSSSRLTTTAVVRSAPCLAAGLHIVHGSARHEYDFFPSS